MSLKDVPLQFPSPHWKTVKKDANLPFATSSNPEQLDQLVEDIQGKLMNKSALDIFLYFFKDQVLALIVAETQWYALQHNDESFATSFNIVLQKRFIGILILSNYSKFFQIGMYCTTNSTLGSEIVKQTMARNFFTKINQYLHFHFAVCWGVRGRLSSLTCWQL